MELDPLLQSLTEALGFDEAVVSVVHNATNGVIGAFDNQYIDPESGRWRSTDAMSFSLPVKTLDEYDALVDRLRDLLVDKGYLPFLATDFAFLETDHPPTLVVLKAVDKMDIPTVMRTVQSALHLGIDDTQMIGAFRDWDRRFNIEFEANSGTAVRLKFDRVPNDMRAFRAQTLAICPTLAAAAVSEEDLESVFENLQSHRKLTLWWD